jgi:hypothetical protein
VRMIQRPAKLGAPPAIQFVREFGGHSCDHNSWCLIRPGKLTTNP